MLMQIRHPCKALYINPGYRHVKKVLSFTQLINYRCTQNKTDKKGIETHHRENDGSSNKAALLYEVGQQIVAESHHGVWQAEPEAQE